MLTVLLNLIFHVWNFEIVGHYLDDCVVCVETFDRSSTKSIKFFWVS